MGRLDHITLIAFDFFGTLARNDVNEWRQTLAAIAERQELPIGGREFWDEFSKHEVQFRMTRTNMTDPEASPPFRTYWEAWRKAFVSTFDAIGLKGDPDAAATYSVDMLADQDPFPEAHAAVDALGRLRELAVLSNADDRFLHGSIAHNGWGFSRVESSESLRAYKPDPRIFARFSERVSVPAESILYVGDSPYDDAHGAKLAGMTTVLVHRDQDTPGRTPPPPPAAAFGGGFRSDAGGLLAPDYAVESLSEIPALFA